MNKGAVALYLETDMLSCIPINTFFYTVHWRKEVSFSNLPLCLLENKILDLLAFTSTANIYDIISFVDILTSFSLIFFSVLPECIRNKLW